jgi:parvulin-like peptidyl-prolyl isomerase
MSRRDAFRWAEGAPRRKRWLQLGFGALAVVGACVGIRYAWSPESASAQAVEDDETPIPAARPAASAKDPNLMAVVNGEKIQRAELTLDCVRHYGNEVLESLVNRQLISAHCKKNGVTISDDEINAEIERLAQRFGVPVDKWMQMLQQERNIKPEQYRRDIIWPTIALRKLAADRLEVSEKELTDAFEEEYGPQVKVRMIGIHGDKQKAAKALKLAKANPKDFAKIAREMSEDVESASANGWVQPVRMHAGEKAIEDAAFALKEGQVSDLIVIREQYVILLCEGRIEPRKVSLNTVEQQLTEMIKERKLRDEAAKLFKSLQENAKVVNVLNDPKKAKEMPGVAATINGVPLSMKELGEECLARHGKDALNGLVNRLLIEQALKQNKLRVSGEAIDEEIADTALRMLPKKKNPKETDPTKKDGVADVEGWLKEVTSEPGVTVELYVRDAVWPSVAMKTLCKGAVKVTDQDMKKAFDANYGERVECAAIVLDEPRKAQKVWELARQKPTRENFGDLAAEHSSDASVRALRGEIPPIRKNGGRPLLEQQAFGLEKGELSGVIQTDGKYVILLCEGRTTPANVTMKDVQSELYDHVYRMKLNDEMGKLFDQLQQTATVTNYLDPSKSHTSKPVDTAARPKSPPRAGSALR